MVFRNKSLEERRKQEERWSALSLEKKVEELKKRLDSLQQSGDTTIDWCVAFNGANTDVLSKAFFGSLFRCCNPVYTRKTQFHIVDNGGVRQSINLIYGPSNPVWYEPVEEWKPAKSYNQYYAESVLTPWDMASYMVENCGEADWCVISHFDMVFKDDILARIIERISTDVGIIGTHCPIMAINRTAYKSRSVSFAPGVGHDVGIALERDLQSKGWRHVKFDDAMIRCFTHYGGGASYHNKEEFDHMRRRAMSFNPDRIH